MGLVFFFGCNTCFLITEKIKKKQQNKRRALKCKKKIMNFDNKVLHNITSLIGHILDYKISTENRWVVDPIIIISLLQFIKKNLFLVKLEYNFYDLRLILRSDTITDPKLPIIYLKIEILNLIRINKSLEFKIFLIFIIKLLMFLNSKVQILKCVIETLIVNLNYYRSSYIQIYRKLIYSKVYFSKNGECVIFFFA